jgi:threonine dehydrogenase-like Zn-dependent dehydrogenase
MSSWATSLPRRCLRLGHPFWGIMKEISTQFALGYDPAEFASSLHAIAEGVIDVTPMITGEVGLDGVDATFDELSDPNRHCKIVVTP